MSWGTRDAGQESSPLSRQGNSPKCPRMPHPWLAAAIYFYRLTIRKASMRSTILTTDQVSGDQLCSESLADIGLRRRCPFSGCQASGTI